MELTEEIGALDQELRTWHAENAASCRLGGISKQGDRYLRRLLVVGATAFMRYAKDKTTPIAVWVRGLMEKLVSVVLANKFARIAWVVLMRGETYRSYGTTAWRADQFNPNWQRQSMLRNDRANGEENPCDSLRLSSTAS